MRITIIGLDNDYLDCVKEMGGRIHAHDGVIDVNFPQSVSMWVDNVNSVINFTSPTVGMVIGFEDFFTIEIM